MSTLSQLIEKVSSSRQHDKLKNFSNILKTQLNISHFWYYHLTNDGEYCYLGTHTDWSEYCINHELTQKFPVLRHPKLLQHGIQLFRNQVTNEFQDVVDVAWEKFHINFSLNLSTKTENGVEAFGFATNTNHPLIDETLLNHLPLLTKITKTFRKDYRELIELAFENQVSLPQHFGAQFYQNDKPRAKINIDAFLDKMGWIPNPHLSPEEKKTLALAAQGYTAKYIAKKLYRSRRTIENRLATIKEKLHCESKNALIKIGQELLSINYI